METKFVTKDDLQPLEQRMETQVANLVQDGTDKILAAVNALAETKADKADVEKLQATAGKAFLG